MIIPASNLSPTMETYFMCHVNQKKCLCGFNKHRFVSQEPNTFTGLAIARNTAFGCVILILLLFVMRLHTSVHTCLHTCLHLFHTFRAAYGPLMQYCQCHGSNRWQHCTGPARVRYPVSNQASRTLQGDACFIQFICYDVAPWD